MTTNNNEIGARRFIIAGLMMFGLLMASTPSHASSVTISSIGTIPINGSVAGQYDLTGLLTWDGTTVKLTDLKIEALSANVSGEINFSYVGTLSAPRPSLVSLNGNWTSGSSNAPAAISGGSIGLTAWATGDWMWHGINTFDYNGASAASSSGNAFGPLTSSERMIFPADTYSPGTYSWFADWLYIYSPTFSAVGGRLNFSLAAAGDGIYLPGSAEVSVSSVPLPGAVWLLTSGLAGLAGLSGFTRRSARPA